MFPEAGVAAEGVPRAGDAHGTKKILGIKARRKGKERIRVSRKIHGTIYDAQSSVK